jgi:hypothetical protein
MPASRLKLARRVASVLLTIAIGWANAQVPANTFEWISLERTQCYGSCPVYSVRIGSDGAISYDGKMYVTEKGKRAASASADELSFLQAAVQIAKFQAMNSTYASERDGCQPVPTDSPGLKITIRQDLSEKSVFYYFGCRGPAQVKQVIWLADTIDRVAGTDRWVAPP